MSLHLRRLRPSLVSGFVFAAAVAGVAAGVAGAQPIGNLDWPSYGNDLANTRFQSVDQITPANVSELKPAWVFHTGVLDPKASLEVSPVEVGGTVYVTDGHDDVFALDATTGAVKWSYTPQIPFDRISLCCGRNNRGIAIGDGKVFLARLDDVLVALDASTGAVDWQKTVADVSANYSMTLAPQFVDGKVIVGLAGGEFQVRGEVMAFDANTGNQVWQFFTTQPDGSWAGNSYLGGGAPVWETAAVDLNLGLIYVNTGNAAPDLNGIHRNGQNHWAASIVALDVNTGAFRWGFQEVHHDIWDYDSAQPPILFNGVHDGRTYLGIGNCSKNGNYYILDRQTGQPVFPVTETPVPSTKPGWQHAWPTQPVSSVEPLTPLSVQPGTVPSDDQTAPQYTPPQETPLAIIPGDDGGCEWPPGAFSPRTHFVYYGTRYEPALFQTFPNNTTGIASTFSEVDGAKNYGIFGATDVNTGKVVWEDTVSQPAKSGLAVAGDLVFFGESNGLFHGADAGTGKILFTFDGTSIPDGGGANASPSVYVSGGREYVVNAFGGNVPDQEFGSVTGDAVVAFALPGS
jgi:PQQ-dependent dehydrogenase (methanol/ethanol family)